MTSHEESQEIPLRPHERAMRRAMTYYDGGEYKGEWVARDDKEALLSYHGAFECVREEETPTTHEMLGQIRAARGVAACLMRGANFPSAYFANGEGEPDAEPADQVNDPLFWLDRADDCAARLTKSKMIGGVRREWMVTQEFRNRYQLRKLIDLELISRSIPSRTSRDQVAQDYRTTWHDLIAHEEKCLHGALDQNRINMARRYAVSEGLYSSRRAGLRIAVGAIALGARSESPHLPTSRNNLSCRERYKVKTRHISGAIGACAVAMFARHDKSTHRRRIALKIAQHII